ncbi:hypothetical protein B0H13DRAFT_2270930 [Mycena leptocephala]|nr:hypothetical protein B0H13DRAFT_2270930 [Mycena leptocephala]
MQRGPGSEEDLQGVHPKRGGNFRQSVQPSGRTVEAMNSLPPVPMVESLRQRHYIKALLAKQLWEDERPKEFAHQGYSSQLSKGTGGPAHKPDLHRDVVGIVFGCQLNAHARRGLG